MQPTKSGVGKVSCSVGAHGYVHLTQKLYKLISACLFDLDIPSDPATLRVAIVYGADKANSQVLNTTKDAQANEIDRVVGFAGSYTSADAKFGALAQVRRDDQFRVLGVSDDKAKAWFCAYYITKDTPKQSTSAPPAFKFPGITLADEQENELEEEVVEVKEYDKLLDENVDNEATGGVDGIPTWGGQVLFDVSALDPPSEDQNQS
jgi:hypothetical protein